MANKEIKEKMKISSQKRVKDIFIVDYKISLLVFISSFICLHLLLSGDIKLNSIYAGTAKTNNNILLTVSATSINYGVSQQPITDINQLMPKLCQNQSVICEGSFCIPGVRKCVCDLRMPVQFGLYCLRQVDIETKCFVTNQCNHTIKDAVCIDINSNSILNSESSKFKLDQWRQLNDLRQQSVQAREQVPKQQLEGSKSRSIFKLANRFKMDEEDLMVVSHYRNSPYEINYNTPELLLQNHTRRKTNNNTNTGDRANLYQMPLTPATLPTSSSMEGVSNNASNNRGSDELGEQSTSISATTDSNDKDASTTTTSSTSSTVQTTKTISNTRSSSNYNKQAGDETSTRDNSYYSTAYYQSDTTSVATQLSTTIDSTYSTIVNYNNLQSDTITTTTTNPLTISTPQTNGPGSESTSAISAGSRKKMIIKTQNWPPGICACPFGYMFDSMLRKCLAVSLADSHCLNDMDCKQISMTHCSKERKKCECDEPLVWDQKELACGRPKATIKTTTTGNSDDNNNIDTRRILGSSVNGGTGSGGIVGNFFENLFQPNMLTANWFSSSGSSALISPTKNNKKNNKKNNQNNNLPPRSPYATLKRPDHKPLSNFTQATRGRILNYDFEQEGLDSSKQDNQQGESSWRRSPLIGGTLKHNHSHHHNHAKMTTDLKSATLKASSSHNKNHQKHSNNNHTTIDNNSSKQRSSTKQHNNNDMKGQSNDEQLLELHDNISVSQLESESKSDASNAAHMSIPPGPPPNQQPPYMLASAMKGQGSAIAAAAAAIANKRMQKKNLEQQPQQQDQQQQQQKYQPSDYPPFTPGHPVFL